MENKKIYIPIDGRAILGRKGKGGKKIRPHKNDKIASRPWFPYPLSLSLSCSLSKRFERSRGVSQPETRYTHTHTHNRSNDKQMLT